MGGQFNVEPDDLDKFATSLRELAGEAVTAVGYADKWFTISGGQTGIYLQVKQTIDQIHADIEGNFKHLQKLTGDSADGIAKAVQVYRTTDHDRAAQLDSTYPGAPQ
jgi:hypothetical protein